MAAQAATATFAVATTAISKAQVAETANAQLAVVATLSPTAQVNLAALATLQGVVTLTATTPGNVAVAPALTAAVAMSVSAAVLAAGNAQLSVAGAMTTSPQLNATGIAALTVTGNVTATTRQTLMASAALAGGAFVSSRISNLPFSAILSGLVTLSVNAIVPVVVIPPGDAVNYIFGFTDAGAAGRDPVIGLLAGQEVLLYFTTTALTFPLPGYQPMITKPGPVDPTLLRHPNLLLAFDAAQSARGLNPVLSSVYSATQLAGLQILLDNYGTIVLAGFL